MFEVSMKKLVTNIAICVAMVSTFGGLQLIALESDSKQQVTWSADGNSNMRILDNSRVLEMTTNVIVSQGSLEIKGDRAIFEYEASTNELRQVQVHGTPVLYQQQLDGDESLVSGVSDSLIFSINDLTKQFWNLLETQELTRPAPQLVAVQLSTLLREIS